VFVLAAPLPVHTQKLTKQVLNAGNLKKKKKKKTSNNNSKATK